LKISQNHNQDNSVNRSKKAIIIKIKHKKNNLQINELFEHFNSLLGETPTSNERTHDENADRHATNDHNLDCEITLNEIQKAVFKQKNNKACGPDEISAEFIKSAFDIISPYLTYTI